MSIPWRLKPGKKRTIQFNLEATSPGITEIRLMLKRDKEIIYEYFSAYKVLPYLSIDLLGPQSDARYLQKCTPLRFQ